MELVGEKELGTDEDLVFEEEFLVDERLVQEEVQMVAMEKFEIDAVTFDVYLL